MGMFIMPRCPASFGNREKAERLLRVGRSKNDAML